MPLESKSSRVPPKKPTDNEPYTDAQLVDVGIAERAFRTIAFQRRIIVLEAFVVVLALLVSTVLASKDHTSALVYREDGSAGRMQLMGYAGVNRTPTELSVENQLIQWIQDVRDVPGNDVQLATRNKNAALLMISRGSLAESQLNANFQANDPAKLSKTQTRTVTHAQINKLSDLTYQIVWTEQSTDQSGNGAAANYQGTVTLAQAPAAPADTVLGQVNPAGVFIANYSLKV